MNEPKPSTSEQENQIANEKNILSFTKKEKKLGYVWNMNLFNFFESNSKRLVVG